MDQNPKIWKVEPQLPTILSLFKEAFNIYNNRFWLLFTISLLPASLAATLSILATSQKLQLLNHPVKLTAATGYNPVVSLLIDVVLVLGMVWGQVALLVACRDREKYTNVFSNYKNALPKIFPFIYASVLSSLAAALGLVFLIIPGIILIIYLSQATFIVVAEDKSTNLCLRRSFNMVKGRWFQVANRFLALLLLVVLVSSLGSAAAGNFTDPKLLFRLYPFY